jgi:glycogen synthase
MKILHILDHYKPHFSGYVFRTSYILKYQKECGLEPVLLTSPKHGEVRTAMEEIDDTKVYRTPQNNFGSIPFIRELRLMNALQNRIEDVIKTEGPDIIHAHSPSLNGMPALKAGRKFGVPVVYEVRALWEDAAVDHGTFEEGSLIYKMSRFLETRLFKGVDAIFTICGGLGRDIRSRGISAHKITIIPNCVDAHSFAPCDYDRGIAEKHGLKDKIVFGFIGSFYHYEGLDILIDSFCNVQRKNNEVRLLLVGDGPERSALYDKVSSLNMLGKVIFTGKVPHDEVKKYYSVIDTLVYPRKKIRLTDLVTPLKPLEAMAMGKIVIGSDVGGLRELVTHNHDGFLFKAGDIEELSRLMIDLASGNKDLKRISMAARERVEIHHKWGTAVKKYLPVYEHLKKRQTNKQ